jgi:hypothetical protein
MKIRRTMVAGSSPSASHPNSPPERTVGTRMTRRKEKGYWWLMKSTTPGPMMMMTLKMKRVEKCLPLLLFPLHLHLSFDSQNENSSLTNHKCLMTKGTELTSSPTPSSSHSKSISMDDVRSSKIKKELVSCDEFIANMKGHTKVYFETLVCQLGDAHDTIKEKEEFERLAADDIGSLSIELKEEENLRASLEEKLLGLEESHNLNMSKLTKERDHALAMVKLLKREKVKFDGGHNDVREKLEKLEEAYKALEGKFYSLTKICKQLQIQLTIEQSIVPSMQVIEVPSSSNPLCDHSNIIEENTRLKAELAKGLVMTHKYRGSQQSSREAKPKFIDSTQGDPKNIYKP